MWKKHETMPSNYAYLYDRIATSWSDISQRKLQLYGTQGKCVGKGKWEALPVQDLQNLDNRRLKVGLGSMAEYKEQFKETCK